MIKLEIINSPDFNSRKRSDHYYIMAQFNSNQENCPWKTKVQSLNQENDPWKTQLPESNQENGTWKTYM